MKTIICIIIGAIFIWLIFTYGDGVNATFSVVSIGGIIVGLILRVAIAIVAFIKELFFSSPISAEKCEYRSGSWCEAMQRVKYQHDVLHVARGGVPYPHPIDGRAVSVDGSDKKEFCNTENHRNCSYYKEYMNISTWMREHNV